MSFAAKSISSSITLSVDDRTRHWLYFRANPRSDAEKATSIHSSDFGGATVQVEQQIHNGRGRPDLKLDDASFELIECPTQLSTQDFYELQNGQAAFQTRYYKEVEEIVQNKLQCDKVLCVQSQVRNASLTGTDGVAGYATGGPHTDSSAVSGDVFALDILKSQGEDPTQFKRYCYLNLWRNIAETPIQDNHLAVLDERTVVKPDDYVCKDLIGDGYEVTQYGLNARHAAQHKWYYFDKMHKNEGILFKQMDSDWTIQGRVCFHMSVSDPTAPPEAADRESIEVRMLCLWKEATVDSMPTHDSVHRDMIQSPQQYAIDLKGGNSLASASILQLLVALLKKVPLLGTVFAALLGGGSSNKSEYTGNPMDYLDRFILAIDAFPSWPGSGKSWAKSTMKQAKTAQLGVEIITKTLVDDSMGYQKTKNLPSDAKAEIEKLLLANDKYVGACQSTWHHSMMHSSPLCKDFIFNISH